MQSHQNSLTLSLSVHRFTVPAKPAMQDISPAKSALLSDFSHDSPMLSDLNITPQNPMMNRKLNFSIFSSSDSLEPPPPAQPQKEHSYTQIRPIRKALNAYSPNTSPIIVRSSPADIFKPAELTDF